ncbi:hypothetical protein JXC34_02130 [Candidatus Woesearchaeota archaeon]|nr:hypothetical protein [Candidatus Woesearchaeota archaeon]
MFLLMCPKCKNKMKYQPRGSLDGKKKKCVYCGYSFTVHPDQKKSRIIS